MKSNRTKNEQQNEQYEEKDLDREANTITYGEFRSSILLDMTFPYRNQKLQTLPSYLYGMKYIVHCINNQIVLLLENIDQ